MNPWLSLLNSAHTFERGKFAYFASPGNGHGIDVFDHNIQGDPKVLPQ